MTPRLFFPFFLCLVSACSFTALAFSSSGETWRTRSTVLSIPPKSVTRSFTVASRVKTTFLPVKSEKSDFEDEDLGGKIPGEEEYTGDVDWDAEWKKVVRNENQPSVRPKGNDIGDVERAARKAQRDAEVQFLKVKGNAKRSLNFDNLKGDWKFWVGVLAVLSVATSLISAAGMNESQVYSGDDSFYV